MKTHTLENIMKRNFSPKEIREIRAAADHELLLMSLRELREEAGKTQVEVSEEAEMAQTEVSRFERRDDHLISGLRRYVKALGGELKVIAVLGDKQITLTGV